MQFLLIDPPQLQKKAFYKNVYRYPFLKFHAMKNENKLEKETKKEKIIISGINQINEYYDVIKKPKTNYNYRKSTEIYKFLQGIHPWVG